MAKPDTSRRGLGAAAAGLLLLGTLSCSGGPTSPKQAQAKIIYAALGASVTFGIGAVPITEGYVYEIADRMAMVRSEVSLHNLGISGARIEDLLAAELEPAVAADPDVVTVWTGSNDLIAGQSAATFGAQLDTLLGELRRRTRALVFVGDLADMTRAPRFRTVPDPDVTLARLDAFNARIRSSVAASGAILVPVSDLEVVDSIFSIDGFHPNNEGHDRLAEIFWMAIGPRL